MTTIHMSLSIRGALGWPKRKLRGLLWDNHGRQLSPDEAREWLLDRLAEGKQVLPMTKDCEGFDYVSGCPGHEETK